MWSLKRIGEGPQNESSYYLAVGEHLVGRKDCQIQIAGDQSVSRKHAWIKVFQNRATTAQVSLKDVSKFGCSVNGIKCQNSVEVFLKHNDKITFGTQKSSYWLKSEPLVVFASCLENTKKKNLKSQLSKLGGYMVNDWQKGCSHLVMEALSFTVKVIYALVTCCPIVTPTFFDDLVQAIESKAQTELPSPAAYIPPIKENLLQESFHPNEARKSVFAGKLFLFFDKKQLKRLEQAITLTGGKALLKETGDICGSDDDLLMDENTLVISADLKSEISDAREAWIGHVGEILKSVNRRPIAETEIGLAILHVSLDEYCNPSINHIPKITKQIVSKSISSMEEMSQRINESQNVSTNQIPEKMAFSLGNDPAATLQDNRKRSRHGSDELQTFAFETPISRNADSKRRKISPSDITHVSQTPEPIFKTPAVLQGTSLVQKQQCTSPTDRRSCETRKEMSFSSIKDVTHVSQSEKLEDMSESPVTGQKRKAGSPSNDITHISQSQESQRKDNPEVILLRSPDSRKLSLSRSHAHVTHISQSQESHLAEKPSDASPRGGKKLKLSRPNANITHISQSQLSQNEEKPQMEKTEEKKVKQSRPDASITRVSHSQLSQNEEKPQRKRIGEITHISQSQNSQVKQSDIVKDCEDASVSPEIHPVEIRVNETPSPEITSASKRRKISSPDLTHISDTERSMTAESHRFTSVSSPTSAGIQNSTSGSAINTSPAVQPGERGNSVRNSPRGSTCKEVDDLSCLKSTVSPSGSGWMSKKSFSINKEKSQMNMTNYRGAVEDSGESSSRVGFQTGNNPKESQEFLLKEEEQALPGEMVVKKEENSEYPSDVLRVEHIELVVTRNVRPKTQQSQKKITSTLKNMKRFRKQNYIGEDSALPKIIGGSDLVVFSARNGNVEDWMVEVEAMNRQDLEDKDADNVFRYEPNNKRRNRR